MYFEEFEIDSMRYVIRYPNEFDSKKRYPAILMLHGAGTRGSDLEKVKGNAFFTLTEEMSDFPFVVFAPQCSKNTWFDHFETLKTFVKRIAALPFIDPSHLYLTGASMGGYGSWQLAMSIPEYFAAVAPVCGGGMYWNAARLANVPVWAFHGALDKTVLPEESEKMVNAVNKKNGNARLTIYPDIGHHAWTPTFSNPALYEWFLSHKNENAKELVNEYADQKLFG